MGKAAVDNEWSSFCVEILKEFVEHCAEVLAWEDKFGTANHYLTAKYAETMTIPESVKDEFVGDISRTDLRNMYNSGTIGEARLSIKKKLDVQLEKYFKEFAQKSLHQQQQQRVFAAVKAHWSVEKKTFLDCILKVSRDIIIKKREEWISASLLTNENILKYASESIKI